MIAAPRLALAALLALAACTARDTVATAVSSQSACPGSRPFVLPDGSCPGALASAVFTAAVCACGALEVNDHLVTDAFDSRVSPWAFAGAGGDVGSNVGLQFPGELEVGGNLTVVGNVQAGTLLTVGGDLGVAGNLGRPSSRVTVGGAARITGGIDVGQMDVTGVLTQPAGALARGTIYATQREEGLMTIAPPCACDAIATIVDGLFQHYSHEHDDASIGLSPEAFATSLGGPSLEISCGVFYLSAIQSAVPSGFTLRATGPSALFVRDAVTPLKIEVAPGAELDLFVDGQLTLAEGDAGDPQRPAALRIYKSGGGTLNIPKNVRLYGSLYAPDTDVSTSAPFEVFGALVLSNLTGGADRVVVHYDRALSAEVKACR